MEQNTFTDHCIFVLNEHRSPIIRVALFKAVVLILAVILSFCDQGFSLAPLFTIWALGIVAGACFLGSEASRRMSEQCSQQRKIDQ